MEKPVGTLNPCSSGNSIIPWSLITTLIPASSVLLVYSFWSTNRSSCIPSNLLRQERGHGVFPSSLSYKKQRQMEHSIPVYCTRNGDRLSVPLQFIVQETETDGAFHSSLSCKKRRQTERSTPVYRTRNGHRRSVPFQFIVQETETDGTFHSSLSCKKRRQTERSTPVCRTRNGDRWSVPFQLLQPPTFFLFNDFACSTLKVNLQFTRL